MGTGSARREGHHGGAGLVQRRTNMANQERRRCCAASWCSCPYPPLDPTWNVPATVRRQICAVPHRVPCDCDLIPAVQHLLHSMRCEVRGRRSASNSVSFSGRSTPFSPRARRVHVHCRRLEKKRRGCHGYDQQVKDIYRSVTKEIRFCQKHAPTLNFYRSISRRPSHEPDRWIQSERWAQFE